jgi:hypothetical protein
MEQKYYCKKRLCVLDPDFKTCNACFEKKLAGFTDMDMCKQYNITYIEEELERW